MSIWGKIKSAGKGLGKVASKAAPFAGLIPGVGTLAATGIGAAGGLLSGKGVKGVLKGAALGAAGSLGGKLISRIPGVGKLGGKLSGAVMNKIQGAPDAPVGAQQMGGDPYSPYDSGADQFMPDLSGAAGGGGIDWGKILGAAGKIAPIAMGAAGALQNAQTASQNRKLTDEQIQQARDAIARQKMLQDQALNPINVQAPDYSSIFGQSRNPFYRPQTGG